MQPPYFIAYKTAEEKLSYQNQIPLRIRTYLMDYVKGLKSEINNIVDNESLETFVEHLERAFQLNFDLNQKIDRFLYHQHTSPFKEWSLEDWKVAYSLLSRAFESDHIKNIYSGATKLKLEKEAERLKKEHSLTDPEFELLLTSSEGTFYGRYYFDHVAFYLQKTSEDFLLKTYHGGDKSLMALRMAEMSLESSSPEELAENLNSYTKRLQQTREKKRKLMSKHPDIESFDKLLVDDNLTSYIRQYSFSVLPDLFLREEIYKKLIENKLADPHEKPDVLSVPKEKLLASVEKMIAKKKERHTVLLSPYLQTDTTCGSCCTMIILHQKGAPLNRSLELEIWEKIGKPFNFPQGSAKILMEKGFNCIYYQYPENIFTKDHPDIIAGDSFILGKIQEYKDLYREAIEKGLQVKNENWNTSEILKYLQEGSVCIVSINLTGDKDNEILHAIIIRGYRNGGNQFSVIDPLGSIKFINRKKLEDMINTSMGKRMVVVRK